MDGVCLPSIRVAGCGSTGESVPFAREHLVFDRALSFLEWVGVWTGETNDKIGSIGLTMTRHPSMMVSNNVSDRWKLRPAASIPRRSINLIRESQMAR